MPHELWHCRGARFNYIAFASVKVEKAEKQKLEVKDVHVQNIVNNHKEVFTGLGKCKDK